jgi:hypothetical protein
LEEKRAILECLANAAFLSALETFCALEGDDWTRRLREASRPQIGADALTRATNAAACEARIALFESFVADLRKAAKS